MWQKVDKISGRSRVYDMKKIEFLSCSLQYSLFISMTHTIQSWFPSVNNFKFYLILKLLYNTAIDSTFCEAIMTTRASSWITLDCRDCFYFHLTLQLLLALFGFFQTHLVVLYNHFDSNWSYLTNLKRASKVNIGTKNDASTDDLQNNDANLLCIVTDLMLYVLHHHYLHHFKQRHISDQLASLDNDHHHNFALSFHYYHIHCA